MDADLNTDYQTKGAEELTGTGLDGSIMADIVLRVQLSNVIYKM
jgi:hypothetical protein